MLSPWDAPQPLTRAWCLWELFCTVETGSEFCVCLGSREQAAFEASLLDGGAQSLQDAFSKIDVANAEAGDPEDQRMILTAVGNLEGGSSRLNALVMEQMRTWVLRVIDSMIIQRRVEGGVLIERELHDVHQLARTLAAMGENRKSRDLFEEVVSGLSRTRGA